MTSRGQVRDTAEEQPILWLGISGFAPQQRASLEAFLSRFKGSARWRNCAFGDADAWWVNGGKVRLLPDGNLKVAAGLPTEHALNLDLAAVDRPVAFSVPLAAADFEPRCTFDLHSDPSMQAVLLQFENWLSLVRAQFVLGARIVQSGPLLRHGIFHVSYRGKLLAVLDFQQGKAAVLPGVHPVDLWEAQWNKRPTGAHDLPESFVRVTPAQLAWAYVRRTDEDMLPPRYRTELIYFRHAPDVPLRWLCDSQLMLLRELSAEPATLDALSQRTGLPAVLIDHDLACLYYSNAITTTRAKARAATPQRDSQPNSVEPDLGSLLRNDAHGDYGLTAPAMLAPRSPNR